MSWNDSLKSSLRIRILIAVVTILTIMFLFPKGESIESEVFVGSIWIKDDLIASLTFEILKNPEVYAKERLAAAEKVPQIFVHDEDVKQKSIDSLKNYNKYLAGLIDESIRSNLQFDPSMTFLSPSSFSVLKNIRALENVLSTQSKNSLSRVFRVSESILKLIYKRGLIDINFSYITKDSIAVTNGKFLRVFPKDNYLDPASAGSYILNYLRRNFSSDSELNNSVEEYITHFLSPNILYSDELTTAEKEAAINKVPKNLGFVNENERIVSKHDRITPEIKLKIDSYRIAKGAETGFWKETQQYLGKFLHVSAILLLLGIYIYLFRRQIYNDNAKLVLISFLILFIAGQTYLINLINVNAPIALLILLPSASMLLTIIFDSRLGFYSTIVLALIAGGLRGNDYVFSVMNITAGALAVFTVRDIKNRNQIFRSFTFILFGYIISLIAFGLEQFTSIEDILVASAFAASNALISPTLTYGLIIFFEKIFKITTDLTLLELTDFNSPVLKELAKITPGTFTHSITIGSMVESAAEKIGANPILARVGAYYHDIGKTLQPEAFAENQLNNYNLHDDLDPLKSSEIIINHITKGIELAKEYDLPQVVIDFIPMHHGTMVASYFLEKYKKLHPDEEIDADNFRYPGPKPKTKETALVMLADACESTVRSMEDLNPQKVENVVNNLIKMRVEEGQLDDSPLTLNDLNLIKDSFQSTLIGQHHRRIRYPQQDELENVDNTNPPE